MSEFSKRVEEQNLQKLGLYINLATSIAQKEIGGFIDRHIGEILLLPRHMEVTAKYYYLAANLLRIQLPNRHEDLVINLISIGLSHHISYLERIKYIKADRYDEDEFLEVYHNMMQALMILSLSTSDITL